MMKKEGMIGNSWGGGRGRGTGRGSGKRKVQSGKRRRLLLSGDNLIDHRIELKMSGFFLVPHKS